MSDRERKTNFCDSEDKLVSEMMEVEGESECKRK